MKNLIVPKFLTLAPAAILALAGTNAAAQIVITGSGLSYSQDFDNLLRTTTAETWVNNADTASANDSPRLVGLLGWYLAAYDGATPNSYVPLIRASNGGTLTGSYYSYGSSGAADRALGSLPSDSTATGSFRIGARFVNNTGTTITGFTFSYDGEQWRKASIASAVNNQFNVSWATFAANAGNLDSGPYSASIPEATFNTPVDGGDSTSASLDGNDAANRVAGLGTTISGLSVANGEEIWLRWFDSNSSLADHGIGIDNFNITFELVPEPSTAGLLGLSLVGLLLRRARRS